jgi:hypothetical protein
MFRKFTRTGLVAALLAACPFSATTGELLADDGEITTAPEQPPVLLPYHYSDELGGFQIASATGLGTSRDPVRMTQRILTASPATMVVRAIAPLNPLGDLGPYATGTIHFELDIINESGVPWIGLELELQEHYTRPSVYGDGLSFDQRQFDKAKAFSSAFADVRHDFEPYDRLLFDGGALDANARAIFRFLVTDLTPSATFYIKLDPRIPAS